MFRSFFLQYFSLSVFQDKLDECDRYVFFVLLIICEKDE